MNNEKTSQEEVCVSNSLNALLYEFKLIKNGSNDLFPQDILFPSNLLFPSGSGDNKTLTIYVDKKSKVNPTSGRKSFKVNITRPLYIFNDVSDEIMFIPTYKDSKVKMICKIVRRLEKLGKDFRVLDSPIEEIIDYEPIELFEGENYIYTNLTNVTITLSYPLDNELNRWYVNTAVYYNDLKNIKTSILDEINSMIEETHYSDVFTKEDGNTNANLNNLKLNCLTSNTDSFSLSKEGKLILNDIEAAGKIKAKTIEYKTLSNVSLEHLKKDFEIYTNGLSIIKDSNIYKYRYLDEDVTDKKHMGLIIGENYNTPKEVLNTKETGVDLYAMISVAWNAIKELNKKIEKMEGDKNGVH